MQYDVKDMILQQVCLQYFDVGVTRYTCKLETYTHTTHSHDYDQDTGLKKKAKEPGHENIT